MRYRSLGQTGLTVSELGLGGLYLDSTPEAGQTARRAVELGVTLIDTAPAYGESERSLGHGLASIDTPIVLSTKIGGRPRPFDPRDARALRRSVEDSLRLLRRDTIDILYVHEPDRPAQYDWWTSLDPLTGPVLDVLKRLKAEGRVRALGLAGTTAYELARLIRTGVFDVVLTAFNYSLLWREAELEILPAAAQLGMGVVVGSPLQQGAFARRQDAEVRDARWLSEPRRRQLLALYDLLDEHGLDVREIALRFAVSNTSISSVLVGARTPQEIEANVRAISRGPLHRDLLAEINALAACVPFRPFDEPAVLPFGRRYVGPGPMA